MNFIGVAKRIEDIDLPRVGAMIGVGEDEIHAVIDVEAAGSGFDNKGRPKMRVEYHYFYRLLPPEKLQKAIDQGLAFKSWRSGKHPRDMYPILKRMMKIDAHVALLSCSWGLGQIMGFNHLAAGYTTVEAMVKAFTIDEDNHLEAMISFIKFNNLDDELREHNWSGFARGYNGSQYAKHGYDLKLAASFDKWYKIRDTPYLIDSTPSKLQKTGLLQGPKEVIKISKKGPLAAIGIVGFVAYYWMELITLIGGWIDEISELF